MTLPMSRFRKLHKERDDMKVRVEALFRIIEGLEAKVDQLQDEIDRLKIKGPPQG